ncbi:hypothetical protein AAF712_008517 [Marasmius tenuissimus]|uniref:Uncharacterized protein n=1 Tax=Marasmius tenuissimus TaxID=585030 RepID=A0ABR2ZWA4_9AGAR
MASSSNNSINIIEISDSEDGFETTKQATPNDHTGTLNHDRLQGENIVLKSRLYETERSCNSYEEQLREARSRIKSAEAAQFSSGRRLRAKRQKESNTKSMGAKLLEELSCQICTNFMSGQPHNPVV